MSLLMVSTTGEQFAYYELDETLKPVEKPFPERLRKSVELIEENCEPALCTVLFVGGAGGSLRAGVVENPVRLTRSVQGLQTYVTVGGAPVYVWPGGGITLMVDVMRVPDNAFGYVPTPALVAPIEFTLRRDDYVALGGHAAGNPQRRRRDRDRRRISSTRAARRARRMPTHGRRWRNCIAGRAAPHERAASAIPGRRAAAPPQPRADRPCYRGVRRGGRSARRRTQQATARFQTILTELVEELPDLRSAASARPRVFHGSTARRMEEAVTPLAGETFITPMAAVAGSVADEILAAMLAGRKLDKAYVNNGGDSALHLAAGQSMRLAIAGTAKGFADRIVIRAEDAVRGVATSGWRGRSFSLGIADAVTVLARTGAAADAAATIIANAVDLPDHPAITREKARSLAPDSDLGDRLVTTDVGALSGDEMAEALENGLAVAEKLRRRGLIEAAALFLNGDVRVCGTLSADHETAPFIRPLRGHLLPVGEKRAETPATSSPQPGEVGRAKRRPGKGELSKAAQEGTHG